MLWSRFFRNGYWDRHDRGEVPWRPQAQAPENPGELGREAKDLLDNPTLHEALDRVERKLQQSWRNSPAGDKEAREEAYRLHWAVEALRAELRIMVANAGMAERRREERDGITP